MSQTSDALGRITNIDTAVKAAQTALQSGVDNLPGEGAQHLADRCQQLLTAMKPAADLISDEVVTLTEEFNRGQV